MNHYFVICDGDGHYARRLAEYMTAHRATYMNIEIFTDREMAVDFCKNHRVKYLLIHEELYEEENYSSVIPNLYFLSEDPRRTTKQHVYKYQSAEKILETVMGDDREQGQMSMAHQTPMHMLCVYSPVRRVVATPFALAMAQVLSKQYKTLYLNLRAFSGVEEYLGKGDGSDLSDVMYAVQTGKEMPSHWREECVLRQEQLEYVLPMQSPADIQSVSRDQWNLLFEALGQANHYDYLVVEVDETIQDLPGFLEQFSWIFTPVASDALSKCQLSAFEQLLKCMELSNVRERMRTFVLPQLSGPETREECIVQLEDVLYRSAQKLLEKTVYAGSYLGKET